ncbi:hypothetical protein BGZ88_005666 [Linnemannia elongata]|nr:hypothetical protein BGZ88_005666 [Linnemannia elongata]
MHSQQQQQQQQYCTDSTTSYSPDAAERHSEGMKLYQYDNNQQQGQGQYGLHHIDSDPDIHGRDSGAMAADLTPLFTLPSQQHNNNGVDNKKQMLMTAAAATMTDMTKYPEGQNDDGHHHYQQQQQYPTNNSNKSSPTPLSSGVGEVIGHGQLHGAQGAAYPLQQRQSLHHPGYAQQPPHHQGPQKSPPVQKQRPKQQQQQQQPQHPPNHYGYDLEQEKQQQRNQRSPSPFQHERHSLYQPQPQQETNRPANNNSNKGQHHPRPPKLIHVAPPQQKEQQHKLTMTCSPSPPPRKESLENAGALAGAGVGAAIERGGVSAQEQVLLDDRAHYRTMMMASADSAVSLTSEVEKYTERGDNSGNGSNDVVWTASPSSLSLDSRSNTLSNTTAATNQSGGSDTGAVGTLCQGGTGAAGVEGGESPLALPNPPFYPQKATEAEGRGGVSKSRCGSMSSADAHVVRGPGWQTRMHGGENGSGSVIVDMGTSTSQPPVPSSPGKTGWEREDATSTTPVPAYQLPAPKNGGMDNGKDSVTGAGAGAGSHQHSHSLFDFFRGRKSSIHKNSTLHQQAAAAAYAASHGSGSGSGSESLAGADGHPPALPLMGTPPSIARSRLGSVAALGPPVPPPLRKQSLDVSALSGYHRNVPGVAGGGDGGPHRSDRHAATMPILPSSASSPAFGVSGLEALTPTQAMDVITSSTIPLTPFVTAKTNVDTTTSSNSTQSTLSKVAGAVVGVTIGKRRPSVVSEVNAGASSHGFGLLKYREKPPPMPLVVRQQQQQVQHQHQHSGAESDGFSGDGTGLDAEQLQYHARFMRSEKSMTELMEYVGKMYHTVMNKDVALEYSRTQIAVLHKELDQNRVRSEDDRKSLTAEVDTVKEQVVKMEENFLLWRTKVHHDQMAQQEEFLQERLVKQDRIEELEDMLHASQEEVTRLRNRLLVLEYEDGYVGATAFLPSSTSDYNHPGDPYNPCTTIAIEHGPMTINSHKRRSGDFRIMEQRAQSFEGQVQELKRAMEKLRQDQGKELAELRMKFGAKCSKLEHDVHAAKMESTMYNEMLHEVVTENEDLRKQLKDAQRQLRRQGHSASVCIDSGNSSSTTINNNYRSDSNSSNATKSKSSSKPRRNPDHYGFPDDGSYSLDGSDDDDMEDIVI